MNKEWQKELQKEKKKLEQCEANLQKAKSVKEQLETAMGDPVNYANKEAFVLLEADYKQAKNNWEQANKAYELCFEKLMELEEKLS